MEKIELKIPNLGEAESTEIIEVNIEPGKEVSLNDPLIVLESEKAAMEIPSDFQGQIKEVLIKEGDEVSEGMVFATMEAVKEETHIEKIDEPKNEITSTEKVTNEARPASYSLKGVNAGPAVRKYARELEIDLQRLEQINRRFSEMGSESEFEEFDLSIRIEKIIKYLSKRLPSIGKTVKLANDIQPGIVIRANGSLLAWSIENIIKNSIDSIDQRRGEINISLRKELNEIKIRIKDNGKGIPKKDWKNIFRPGFSTKKAGWGLGLSLANRIIEDIHKGNLRVLNSTINKGTIIEIIL